MVKAKKGANRTRKSRNRNNRAARQPMRVYSGDGSVLTKHWDMLSNPCSAPIGESAYRGAAGVPSRFTRTQTIQVAGSTCFAYLATPSALSAFQVTTANSAVAITPVYGTSMAGQTFVLANSAAFRIIGFCFSVEYIGTELNRSGKMYTGIVNAQTIPAGVATTGDAIKTLLTSSTRTPDGELESLWFPGVSNEDYGDGLSTTHAYDDGKNTLVFYAEGLPDGVQIQIRETVIVEWQPKTGNGFTVTSPAGGTNPIAAYEKLHAAAHSESAFGGFRKAAANRFHDYASLAGRRIVDFGAAAAYGMGKRALGAASRVAPLMLA